MASKDTSKDSDDTRQLMAALQGTQPLSPEIARATLAPLERELQERFEYRRARNAEVAEYADKILAPLRELMSNDPRVAEGIKMMNESNSRRAEQLLSRVDQLPDIAKVEPQVMLGSLLFLTGAPYDYDWDWNSERGVESVRADKDSGIALWSIRGRGDSAAAAAGVGYFLRPLPDTNRIRFSPYTKLVI